MQRTTTEALYATNLHCDMMRKILKNALYESGETDQEARALMKDIEGRILQIQDLL